MVSILKRRGIRLIAWILLVFFVIVLILIIAASPLAKYMIEKYDTRYTGREITVRSVFVNPVAGYVRIKDLNMNEKESDSSFFFVKRFTINLSVIKLLTGVYQVSSVDVIDPEIKIIQTDTVFNFTDLLEKFTMNEKDTTKPPAKVNILDIRVTGGNVTYESNFPLIYHITDINLSSPGMRWNRDSVTAEFSLRPEESFMSGNMMVNTENMDFRSFMDLQGFNPGIAGKYLQKYAKDAEVKGLVNMKIYTSGNARNPKQLRARGRVEADSFHLGRSGADYFAFDRFILVMRDIDLAKKRFFLDTIRIDKPVVLFQKYDSLDNFRRMLIGIPESDTAAIKDTLSMLAHFKDSDYSIGYFGILDGNFEFNDYSIAEKFSMAFSPFTLQADSVDRSKKRVHVSIKSGIRPYGSFNANLSMDPENDRNFDFNYRFSDISAPSFNPYIITFTSFQLDRGQIEMHGKTSVKSGKMRSLNHFILMDPRDTKKVKGKASKWVPLPLILSLVRERGGAIDYEIPITGDLNDPSFHLGDVISDLLRNILVKPPTTPYSLQVKTLEKEVEKSLSVTWKMRQTVTDRGQKKFLEKIADFLKDNPEAGIVISPVFHEAKEKENILLFEAKKKYFYRSRGKEIVPLSENDSMKVEKLSSKDSSFIRYIDRFVKNPALLTLQEKCYNFIGREVVSKRYEQMKEARKQSFMAEFMKNKTGDRVGFVKDKTEIPVNWFSYYGITYKGDVPEKLKESFEKLYEINTEPPRREYLQLRQRK